MKNGPAIGTLVAIGAAILLISWILPDNDKPSPPPIVTTISAPTPAVIEPAGLTNAEIAAGVRADIEALQPSWLPYLADVTYSGRTLTVALQVDRTTDRELAEEIGKAIRANVRLGAYSDQVDWIHVTDGAGNHITQEGAR